MTIWNPGAPITITGDFLPPITGAYSLGSTTFKWLNLWLSGTLNVSGQANLDGNLAVGNAGSVLTFGPSAVSWPNNPTHSGNHTFSGNLNVQGASSQIGNQITDVVDIAAGTIHTDGANKVGIGTNVPVDLLHIYGSGNSIFRAESTAAASAGFVARNTLRQRTIYVNSVGNLSETDDTAGTIPRAVDALGNQLFNGMAAGTNLAKGFAMANGTAPTTSPAGGGQLYVEAGALKYRGSAGTVTVLGVA